MSLDLQIARLYCNPIYINSHRKINVTYNVKFSQLKIIRGDVKFVQWGISYLNIFAVSLKFHCVIHPVFFCVRPSCIVLCFLHILIFPPELCLCPFCNEIEDSIYNSNCIKSMLRFFGHCFRICRTQYDCDVKETGYSFWFLV